MKASLEYLAKYTGTRKIAVLGDMFELGEYAIELHKKVGKEVAKNKIDILMCTGENSKYIVEAAKENNSQIEAKVFENKDEIYENLCENLQEGDVVLVKASNGMKFFEICQKL